MAKENKVQNSFLSGVLDPRASARVGTEAYQNGLLIGRNVIPVHLGGVRRRPGMKYVNRLSNVLQAEPPFSATAPNGGSAPNAVDGDPATLLSTSNAIGTTDPYVVMRFDMGVAMAVRYADIVDIRLTSGSSTEFELQYSTDDSNWTTALNFLVDTTARTYRISPFVTARYWRVARIGSTDLSTATIVTGGMDIWTETDEVSAVKLIPFELSADERYCVVVTDRSGYLFEDGALVPGGWFPLPYVSADIAGIDADTGADSLFLVHTDYPPRFLTKEPTGLGWLDFQSGPVTFDFVPEHDFNDDDSPTPTSAVQVITLSAGWIRGDSMQIELDGARTGAIAYAGDSTADEQNATAANMEREIQKLYTVPGFDGVSVARTGVLAYTVTFAGASAKPYGLMSVLPLVTGGTGTATGQVTSSVAGVSRHEPVWSATRGYPSVTAFFEGRWYLSAPLGLPKSWFGSAVNNVTYFDTNQALASDALSGTFDGKHSIVGMYAGRALQFFTTTAEFRYIKQPGEAITPSDVPRKQTEYGARHIRPVGIDGATIFVQRNGKSIRDFKFDINEDSYTSVSLASLAPHLLNDIVDVSAWNGSSTDEINLVFVVNGDGTMAVLNTRREAEVTAWTQWITGANAEVDDDGVVSGHDEIKAVCCLTEDIYFATQRSIGGEDVLYLEIADEDMRMDAAVLKNYNLFGVGADYVVNFAPTDPLIGEECRVTIDGMPVDNLTPASGANSVVIAETYEVDSDNTEIRIGLNFDPQITPMPFVKSGPHGDQLISKARIVKVKLRMRDTLGVRVNGRPIPDRKLDVNNFDEGLLPYTGNATIEETTNWDETQDKLVHITQVDPLPMELLGIEVELEG